jgi:hypothetical protein
VNDRGYPESWPELARWVWRDKARRRNAAIILATAAGVALAVVAALLGEVWLFWRT